MSVQFRNLIFEGGGVKGIAYVGAMQVLEQRGILKDIRRAGGTSAGAINALLFALGFDIPSQRQILESTEFKKFMDDSFGVIRDIRRLAKLFDREGYIDMKKESVAAKTTEYYNKENARFLLDNPKRKRYVYNRQTLGLRLDTRKEIALFRYNEPIKGKKIKSFTDYARSLISAVLQVQENQHLHSDDWQRTIYIDTLDVRTTDFDLSDQKKNELLQSGINGAESYFQWFEDPQEKPANRIEQ